MFQSPLNDEDVPTPPRLPHSEPRNTSSLRPGQTYLYQDSPDKHRRLNYGIRLTQYLGSVRSQFHGSSWQSATKCEKLSPCLETFLPSLVYIGSCSSTSNLRQWSPPAILAWLFPGPEWFYTELIPAGAPPEPPDARTTMATWQLVNCTSHSATRADMLMRFTSVGYMLVALISSLVFRAIWDTLPNNPAAQERILGANLTALLLVDVTHTIVSWVGLPEDLRYSFGSRNAMTHGNVTFVIFLLGMRLLVLDDRGITMAKRPQRTRD